MFNSASVLLRIHASNMLYMRASGNYTEIYLTDGTKKVITKQLGQVESLFTTQLNENYNHFLRIGKSLIINLDYLFCINLTDIKLILSANNKQYELSASADALKNLKEYIISNL